MCILKFLCWLFDCGTYKLSFATAEYEGFKITGKIKMAKFEFNQQAVFTAVAYDRRGNVVGVEPGSAQWRFVGTDADGNDVSDSVTVEVDPLNELSATVTSGEVELTGVLEVMADGDPDAGEYFPIKAFVAISVDAPNAVVFELTGTTPVDV